MSRTTQLEEIPTKIVKKNLNIFATFLLKNINTCIRKGAFPDKLKTMPYRHDRKSQKNNG